MRTLLLFLFGIGCGKASNPGFGGGGLPIGPGSDNTDGNQNTEPDAEDSPDDSSDTGNSDASTDTEDTGEPEASDDGNEEETTDEPSDDTGVTIEPTGYDRGDVAYNLTATDQSGTPFSLHDLYGQNVALTVGNINVATTVSTLEGIQEISSDHSGVRFIAFVGYDSDGVQCDQACALEIASTYGYSTVLFDPSLTLATLNTWIDGSNTQTYLIDSSMQIHWKKSGTANADVVSGRLEEIE